MRPIRGGALRAAALAALLAPALAGCGAHARGGAPGEGGAVVAGKVSYRGVPVPNAVVTLYDRFAVAGRHSAATARTESDGTFAVAVRPGSYFVEAEGEIDRARVFAFTGQNPVRAGAGGRPVVLKAVPRTGVEVAPGPPERGAILEGEVVFAGRPVEGANVHVYASSDGLLKGMGVAMSEPTGADGRFRVENLGESFYYVVARRRAGAASPGPLAAGELYGYFPGNPLPLKDRTVTRIRIEAVEKETQAPPPK